MDASAISLPSPNEIINLEPQINSTESIESNILLWVILGVLVAVITMSTVLSFKLWALERELSVESIPDYESLRYVYGRVNDWHSH